MQLVLTVRFDPSTILPLGNPIPLILAEGTGRRLPVLLRSIREPCSTLDDRPAKEPLL